jgi:hypothetical protein
VVDMVDFEHSAVHLGTRWASLYRILSHSVDELC